LNHLCSILSSRYQRPFSWVKATRAWSWPFTAWSAKVKNAWSYTSTPPYIYMV